MSNIEHVAFNISSYFVKRDYFGVAGETCLMHFHIGTRQERSRATRALFELAKAAKIVPYRAKSFYIMLETDTAGQQRIGFYFTLPEKEKVHASNPVSV